MSDPRRPPVLLVHGIWDDGSKFATLARALRDRGLDVHTIDLVPNDGRAKLRTLAETVEARAATLVASSGGRIDVVGFSMGALVTRTMIQFGRGKELVRRFVSISGPHAGTVMAYGLALEGARDMRPGSALLRELEGSTDPFGDVAVHVLYTPFDLMIVPARSSVLAHARSVERLPLLLHRHMITSPRATKRITELLEAT